MPPSPTSSPVTSPGSWAKSAIGPRGAAGRRLALAPGRVAAQPQPVGRRVIPNPVHRRAALASDLTGEDWAWVVPAARTAALLCTRMVRGADPR